MFERFTADARQAVVTAQEEARSLGHSWLGDEHLLLAVLGAGTAVGGVLGSLGLTPDRVRAELASVTVGGADASAALRDLGIDVDEVRRRVEASFGAGALDAPAPRPARSRFRRCGPRGPGGHLPFTAEGKKALELALREALRLGSKEITSAHLVLGVLRADGRASAVVGGLGVSTEAVRRAMLEQLGRAA